MARTAALTGATGFIGGHLVRRLAGAGWRLRVLVRQPAATLDGSVERIQGAIADQEALGRLVTGAEAVVHAAGLVKARRRQEFYAVNTEGTGGLARAASDAGAARFVLLSSLAAREPAISPYADSKRAGEEALAAGAGAMAWTVLRPPAVYGPGDREILALFRSLARGIAPMLGSAQARVSLIHADDLASAVPSLLETADTAGGVFEIDDGREGGYSWAEIVDTAAGLLGRRVRLVRVPGAAVKVLAAGNAMAGLFSARARMLTAGKAREILHPDWACHDRRLPALIGWRPAWSLRDGFADTIAWYRSAGWL